MTSRPVDTPMTSTAGKRSWRRAGIRLGGSALVLTLLFVFLPLQELLTAIKRVPAGLWLLVLASYLGTHALGVAKWRLMVNLAGGKLTLIQAVRCYFAGLFGSVFLPSLVGGDVIRVGLALRYSRNRAGVFLGSLIDRMLDVTAMAALAGVGAVLLPQALNPQGRAIFWGLALIFLILAFTALGLLVALPPRRFSFRTRRLMAKVRQAVRSISRRPYYVLLALSLGVAMQTSFTVLTALIGLACGITLPLGVWLFAYPLSTLSALLPVTQGGIGVREAALAALLVPFGISAALSVAVGLVWQSVVITGGLLSGLISLLVGKFLAVVPGPTASMAIRAEDRLAIPRS